MIVTASTVKDSPENLRTFVARNLAGGVDHLAVFVDDGDAEVVAALAAEPHVTPVAATGEWWQGKRPVQLNARQRINANVLKTLLLPLGGVEWIFHIDADEVLLVDAEALAALPADVEVTRALPYEAVSREAVARRHGHALQADPRTRGARRPAPARPGVASRATATGSTATSTARSACGPPSTGG